MKLFAIPTLVLCALAAEHVNTVTAAAPLPVLIELFTSEGCSSCPPADAFLEKMDSSQPVPGVELIVLSEHVDYWNHDGWKDPYSAASFSDRQTAYASALRIEDVYTPQLIVDGTSILQLSGPAAINQVIQKAATAPSIPVRIESISPENSDGGVLHARIEADGKSEKHKTDIYVAVALNRAESHVSAGENRGRRLTHVAVVEYLKKIGTLEVGTSFNKDFEYKLKPGMNPANLRIIAFAQEPGPGKVVGAALRKVDIQAAGAAASSR